MFSLRFTKDELWRLKDSIEAASDPDQRTPMDDRIIAEINRAWLRANATPPAAGSAAGKGAKHACHDCGCAIPAEFDLCGNCQMGRDEGDQF